MGSNFLSLLPRSEVSADLEEAVHGCGGATPRAGCLDNPAQLSHEPRRDVDQARQGFYEVAGGLVGCCAWSSAKVPEVEGLESKPSRRTAASRGSAGGL
jgi:hypothetical protein